MGPVGVFKASEFSYLRCQKGVLRQYAKTRSISALEHVFDSVAHLGVPHLSVPPVVRVNCLGWDLALNPKKQLPL
jgi:hypothetical protein